MLKWTEEITTARAKRWCACYQWLHELRICVYLLHGRYVWFLLSKDEQTTYGHGDEANLTQVEDAVKRLIRSLK